MKNGFKKILIANRSEIASRIIFSCKTLDIKTVAIYSPEDTFLSYVYQADENHPLSLNGYKAYLNQDEIIEIALKTNSDAIHPGYGFLSENWQFAQKVFNAGLIWIGPESESIKLMGDKSFAKKMMQEIGVPTIPGFQIPNFQKSELIKLAEKIGYPILLKDPLGGGGKAIKKVDSSENLEKAFEQICNEAKKLTGTNQIILEKYITNGRHIEIQIAGDSQNFIHLYERECSIQRRHQKIIEEAPCNFVSKILLEKMYIAAILAAKTVNYKNLGTVEFIVTPQEDFYFLEMNTRLQVEHSVTEFTTGLDLVKLQIEIAQTNKLPLTQSDIKSNNHAIECRIYSEDAENNFAPSTGTITNLQLTSGPFIRHDHNLEENIEVTSFFDPMLSKITTWGKDRNSAIKNMIFALNQLSINGIKTNIDFLKSILNSEEFLEGKIHTQFLNNKRPFEVSVIKPNEQPSQEEIALIATTLFAQKLKPKEKNSLAITENNWRKQQWS